MEGGLAGRDFSLGYGQRLGVILVLAAWLVLPQTRPGLAQGGDAADKAAIVAVIQDQLAAFHADDGNRAFSHASPGIRAMFGQADTFMSMVRQGYPPVYRSRSVDFRSLSFEQGGWVQRVYMVGPKGRAIIARYRMERQPDGSWKINGVSIEQAPDLSV